MLEMLSFISDVFLQKSQANGITKDDNDFVIVLESVIEHHGAFTSYFDVLQHALVFNPSLLASPPSNLNGTITPADRLFTNLPGGQSLASISVFIASKCYLGKQNGC
jgi:hypothetical protein